MTRFLQRVAVRVERSRRNARAFAVPALSSKDAVQLRELNAFLDAITPQTRQDGAWKDALAQRAKPFIERPHAAATRELFRVFIHDTKGKTGRAALDALVRIKHPSATLEPAIHASINPFKEKTLFHWLSRRVDSHRQTAAFARRIVNKRKARSVGARFNDQLVIQACGLLGSPGRKVLREFIRHPTALYRQAAVLGLARQNDSSAVRLLQSALSDADAIVRLYAAQGLLRLAAKAKPRLDHAFLTSLRELRRDAAVKLRVPLEDVGLDGDASRIPLDRRGHASIALVRLALSEHERWAEHPDERVAALKNVQRVLDTPSSLSVYARVLDRLSDPAFARKTARNPHLLVLYQRQVNGNPNERFKT